MVTLAGHAYPWDVVGDPGFTDRVRAAGVDSVTLAASYHSARAATPLHPAHQLVDARDAALYRPIRESVWSGRRLRPIAPQWMETADGFGEAADVLTGAGIPVAAWIVLTHNTRLGLAHPDVAVVNCFGEPYPYALCPAHAEVRDYAALLAAEAVRDGPVTAVSVEACGQLGIGHLGHHEKTDGAWTPAAQRWLSVCCCAACRAGWRTHGHDPERVVAALRDAVRGEAHGTPAPPHDDLAEAVLATRHGNVDLLRGDVLTALREAAPGAEITLHGNPDPWATGPSVGITDTTAADVDALLVPAWPTTEAAAAIVAGAAAHGRPVDAYVTVLPPTDRSALPGHVRRLAAAGATRFSLYHLGLAPAWRQDWFTDIREALA
ncbi:hypothetical protein LX16_0274 [Stackebrandtia albiflava]|uniref:Alanine-rich protein n=1 Tax=Stackebrandtia albiflava TaxID=406432 RepID=A0A562V9M6_9ACTN|nr:hypothetical protein [Stackebrandtia albiflava]TWJ14589.1 hypothetical protein LX16_0274 [Stackebrandtia albiflava]